MNKPSASDSSESSGFAGFVLRLFWMAFGNIVLFLMLIYMGRKEGLGLTAHDAVFWAVAAAMVLARYLDITRFQGSTSYGEPATVRDFRKYALLLALASLSLWAAAHGATLIY
ncbi:MAG TPA: hypothetical protein VM658_21370 [bacterium]|nr:hypothetical protein [bacterium]